MASTGNIHMSPEEMETEALGFEKDKDDFVQVVSSMKSRVESLCSTWEGQASQSFSMQFEELEPGFSATAELITDIATQLRNISLALQDADSQIASKIGVQ